MTSSRCFGDQRQLVGRERSAGPAGRARSARCEWKAYLYILPAFVLFAVFLGVPAVQTAQYSLFKWNGIGPSTWVGLQNYADLFTRFGAAQLVPARGGADLLLRGHPGRARPCS